MARYITPSKIGVLALVTLYTDSFISTTSAVPILSFIVSTFLGPSDSISVNSADSQQRRSPSSVLTVEDFHEVTQAHASSIPGRTVWDLFLKRIWSIDSLDALHVLFDGIPSLLAKSAEELRQDAELGIPPPYENQTLMTQSSPCGTFLRRMHLEFTRLQFHDAISLWKSFITYREPTLTSWRKRNPDPDPNAYDSNLPLEGECDELTLAVYGDMLEDKDSQKGRYSSDDMERLMEFQVDRMQRLGTRVPTEMKEQFRLMIDSNVSIPSVSYYVKFLDAWRAGDYPTSFDTLHRYFDYTMRHRDRTFYQYALLNLGILQAHFNCYDEAAVAMQEAISSARENKDIPCLNFCLSWLYHLGKAHPKELGVGRAGVMLGIERDGFAFLKAKAKESSMYSLWSTSLLGDAKLGLENGQSVPAAFESIWRSSHLNSTKGMKNAMGAQMTLQASLWGRLGVSALTWAYCDLFLECYSTHAPFEDVLKCQCRCAYLMAQGGRFSEAEDAMARIDSQSLRTLSAHHYWTIFSGILKTKRQLHRNNIIAVRELLAQLQSQEAIESDISFEIDMLHLELLYRQGDFNGALSKLAQLLTELTRDQADLYHSVRLLTFKAKILVKCGRPERAFSIAVRAANLAWRSRFLPPLWYAMNAISSILIHLGEFQAASNILSSIMPQVLECEDVALAAQSYSWLVDAHMGIAGQAEAASPERNECLMRASDFIDAAFLEYSRLQDIVGQCEMMAKKGKIMQLVGDTVLANDCAARYVALQDEWRAEVE
ncbi:MAG: hypothetical protein M1825_005316 [Sarcosagium campestre]|nr:MAG: hypothetical protein M1825_005316 [Sarcosagium campestre]